MSADIQATIDAANGGLSNVAPAAGASLIAQWEQDVASLDAPEVKRDLAALRQELESTTPDLPKAAQLVRSLGHATTKIGDSEGNEDLRKLGMALTQGA